MLKFHEVCTLFPEMDPDEKRAMLEDIRQNGVRIPVWVWKDQVIDGRHRFICCQELGIECPTQEYTGTEDQIVSFVMSLNASRRHLSSSQRAAVACQAMSIQRRLRDAAEKEAKPAKPGEPTPKPKPVDEELDDLAKQIGTNRRYLRFADKLRVERPDLFKKVVNGDVKLRTIIDELGDDLMGGKESDDAPGVPDEDEQDEITTDELGHEIPADLRECWDMLKEFDALCALQRDFRKRVKVLCDTAAGAYLERALPEMNAASKSLEKELKTMAPYTVCPHCNGDCCNQCRGMGWIPRGVFDLASEEDRERWSNPAAAF